MNLIDDKKKKNDIPIDHEIIRLVNNGIHLRE